MKIKNNTFPYPVLCTFTDDYKDSLFDMNVDIHNEYGTLWMNYEFTLNNEELEQMLLSRQAVFLIHIECSQTTYRKAITLDRPNGKLKLDTDRIKGNVDINGFIVANGDIPAYTNSQFNEWYEDATFKLTKGNILAVADTTEVQLSEQKDDFKNIQSIINVRRSTTQEYMTLDYSTDKIIISLPKESYEIYANYAKTEFKEIIIANVVFPALVHMFTRLEHQTEEYEDNRWYQVIKNIMNSSGDDITQLGDRGEASYIIVQKLMHHPVFKSLNAIKIISERSED